MSASRWRFEGEREDEAVAEGASNSFFSDAISSGDNSSSASVAKSRSWCRARFAARSSSRASCRSSSSRLRLAFRAAYGYKIILCIRVSHTPAVAKDHNRKYDTCDSQAGPSSLRESRLHQLADGSSEQIVVLAQSPPPLALWPYSRRPSCVVAQDAPCPRLSPFPSLSLCPSQKEPCRGRLPRLSGRAVR